MTKKITERKKIQNKSRRKNVKKMGEKAKRKEQEK